MTRRDFLTSTVFVATAASLPSLALAWAGPPTAAEIQSAASDAAAQAFYTARGWRAAWSAAAEAELRAALARAQAHALSAEPLLDIIDRAQEPAAREAALTTAGLTYAQALSKGAVDPRKLHDIFTLETHGLDVGAGLSGALDQGRLEPWLASLAPQDADYSALSAAYLQERARAAKSDGPEIAAGPLIRPGDQDARLPLIRRALRRDGYLPRGGGRGSTYDEDTAQAVRRMQTDAGLAVDAVIGPHVIGRLNAGPTGLARKLAVNLERRRWLARRPPALRIDVNTAATELSYVVDGRPAWRTRVIAGRADRPTPMLQAPFSRLVVNPPWYVPESIARSEILPKGAGYLRRHGMRVVDGRVIQAPGQSALGQVKFDMQDDYAIYLHDTRARSLFSRHERHRSHGCVRVEQAVAFARRLAAESGRGVDFDRILRSGDTGVVELGRDYPVRLIYATAFVGEDREVRYARDAYGWDDALARALGIGAGGAERAPRVAALLGP